MSAVDGMNSTLMMALHLQGFEQVRKICVDSEPFSVENGLTTPTFKHKRPQLLQHYKAQIDKCVHIPQLTPVGPETHWSAVTRLSCDQSSPDENRTGHLLQQGMSSPQSWPMRAELDLKADILRLVRLVLQPCLSSPCTACA